MFIVIVVIYFLLSIVTFAFAIRANKSYYKLSKVGIVKHKRRITFSVLNEAYANTDNEEAKNEITKCINKYKQYRLLFIINAVVFVILLISKFVLSH